MTIKFSLIIPCYNEAANLPLLIERCQVFALKTDIEVILVDNGSTDATQEKMAQILSDDKFIRSVRVEKNQGYGFGILSGLQVAQGRILGWTHADMQTDPQDILQGLDLFEKYGDNILVKGQRYGRSFVDVFFTIGMSIFETILLGKRLWDINAQPTLFSRSFFDCWQSPPYDFSLDLYTYYQARIYGLQVCRFPVKFRERAHGVSHWNVNWQAKWKFICRTIDFSLKLKKKKTAKTGYNSPQKLDP